MITRLEILSEAACNFPNYLFAPSARLGGPSGSLPDSFDMALGSVAPPKSALHPIGEPFPLPRDLKKVGFPEENLYF